MPSNIAAPTIIGIMGTIGSGKTTVSNILEAYGAYVINADIEARLLMLPDTPAALAVKEAFGASVMLHGTNIVDRKALSDLVFHNPKALETLNSIMHPMIRDRMYFRADTAARVYGHKLIVFDAPLLVEANLHQGLRHIWLVTADNEIRIQRVMHRSSMTRDEAVRRINTRASDQALAQYATSVIENNGSYAQLTEQVKATFTAELGDIADYERSKGI